MAITITLWVAAVVLMILGLAGLVLPALPGAPMLFAGLVLAAWAEGFAYVGGYTLVFLGLLAVLTYAVDFLAGAFGAKRFGASKRGAFGALLGAVVGIFFGLPGVLLGPFVGAPTEHVRIPFGKGICGQAAAVRETVIIQDVSKVSNYLSCAPDVRSEIVVPIFDAEGLIAGELDIDSHELAPFSFHDREFLEYICRKLTGCMDLA